MIQGAEILAEEAVADVTHATQCPLLGHTMCKATLHILTQILTETLFQSAAHSMTEADPSTRQVLTMSMASTLPKMTTAITIRLINDMDGEQSREVDEARRILVDDVEDRNTCQVRNHRT